MARRQRCALISVSFSTRSMSSIARVAHSDVDDSLRRTFGAGETKNAGREEELAVCTTTLGADGGEDLSNTEKMVDARGLIALLSGSVVCSAKFSSAVATCER